MSDEQDRRAQNSEPDGSHARIAIVGAGIAGLACAHALVSAGHHVQVFDKSGAVSGRSATRITHGRLFDHGAPGLRNTDVQRSEADFQALVRQWLAGGTLAQWEQDWLVAPRGMRSLGESLALMLPPDTIHTRREVTALVRSNASDAWHLEFRNTVGELSRDVATAAPATREAHAPAPHKAASAAQSSRAAHTPLPLANTFAHVVLAVPAPQAAQLLPADHAWQAPIANVQYAPCWAVLATVMSHDTATPRTLIVPCNDPLPGVAWCDSAKPGRVAPDGELWWTLHADTDWSVANLENSSDEIAHRGRLALAAALAIKAEHISAVAHRWRFATVATPLRRQPFLNDQTLGLSCTGDWCAGSGIAAAWQSGTQLGALLADQLTALPPRPARLAR